MIKMSREEKERDRCRETGIAQEASTKLYDYSAEMRERGNI